MEYREGALTFLQETYDVVHVILSDLARYKEEATSIAQKMGMVVPCPDSVGGDDVVLVGSYTHSSQVSHRLDFLGYVPFKFS